MIYTIKKLIELKLLDDYMPDRTSYASKANVIRKWIDQGILGVIGGKGKKKLITSEAIAMFKDNFTTKK